MIRPFRPGDLEAVLQVWLEANCQAHSFIPRAYWEGQRDAVRQALPQAELYVHQNGAGRVDGFVGLNGDWIEGIFVAQSARCQGVGRQLMERARAGRPGLRLQVYRKNTRALAFYLREGFRVESEGTDPATGQAEYTMVWQA